jgi:hypothetical protein
MRLRSPYLAAAMNGHQELAALPGVGRITVHAGQVLVYPHHTPPGLFVVLTGVLCRFAEGTVPAAACGDHLNAAAGPFAVPAPDEVDRPARAGFAAETDAQILFVPRSTVLARADLSRTLTEAGVAIVPDPSVPTRRSQR